jgi:type I restriction enzyme, S subunit
MGLKPGYKQTEVGVIPEEWEVKTVKEFATVRGGKRLPLGRALTDKPTNHPYIRVIDMRPGGVDLREIKYVPDDAFPAIKNYRIFTKNLFISVAGTLGVAGKVPPELDGANLTENADKITDICCDQDFLLHNLLSERIQRSIEAERTLGAQPKLALGRIEKFKIALPPTSTEQRAIAGALGDVDTLLRALEKLIAKKRDLRQAAMQQLLTGQKRLPGFSGEWELRALGDGIALVSGHHVLAQHCNGRGDGVPYLTGPADFPNGKIHHTKFTERPTTLCAPDDILVTVKGSGSGSLVVSDALYCISRQLMAIRVRDWNGRFIYYSLLQNASQIKAASTGLIPGLSRSDILEQPLPVPPSTAEQTAIAEVLSDMDAEIAALEQRLAKTRALKQGMMQELLTGKTRLV